MNKTFSLLLTIVGAVLLILACVAMCSCNSTKKSVQKLAKEFEKSGWTKSDSSSTSKKDSSSTATSTSTIKIKDSSGYEKETDESILEWIVMEDTLISAAGGNVTIGAGSPVKVIKRKIKEKGHATSDKQSEDTRTAAIKVSGADSTGKKLDAGNKEAESLSTENKNVKKTKFLPGWAWLAGLIIILSVTGVLTKNHWMVWLKRLKNRNNETV